MKMFKFHRWAGFSPARVYIYLTSHFLRRLLGSAKLGIVIKPVGWFEAL